MPPFRRFSNNVVDFLKQAIRENRKLSVYTRSYIFQGFGVSLGTQVVKTARSDRYNTEQYVLEMVNVVSIPRRQTQLLTNPNPNHNEFPADDGSTVRCNRAHVAMRDIEFVEWAPPVIYKDYVSLRENADFNRRFAAYQGTLSREDCEFLWWIGVRDFPDRSMEYLAVAAFTAIRRESFPDLADAVVYRLLESLARSSRSRSGPSRSIHRNPFLRNLIPYLPADLLTRNFEEFSGPVYLRHRRRGNDTTLISVNSETEPDLECGIMWIFFKC